MGRGIEKNKVRRNRDGDDPQFWLRKYGPIEELTPRQMMDMTPTLEHHVWRYNLARLTRLLGKSYSWIRGLESKGRDFWLVTRIGRHGGDLEYHRYLQYDSKAREYMGFDVRTGKSPGKYNSYNREQPRRFARSTVVHDFQPYSSVVIGVEEFQKAFRSV